MRIYGSLRIAALRLGIAVLAAALLARLYFEMDQERILKLAWHYGETEVMDSTHWRLHAWKRLVFGVPHYKSNAELDEEYSRRFGRKPG